MNKARQVKGCRARVESARSNKDQSQLALALADLGYALFQIRHFEDGLEAFAQAEEHAAAVDDLTLRKQCLGRQVLGYQSAGRLPDAYQVATQIFELGEAHADPATQCDGRLSQGQTLLDSGEPLIALERFQEALLLARALSDRHREMNVIGSLGHLSLGMAATDQAETYFRKALAIACEVGDPEAEYGYLGNVAMVLAFHRRYGEAVAAFETVLAYFEQENNQRAAMEALRHLVQSYGALDEGAKVVAYTRRGLELAAAERSDDLFFFYEQLILALYRLDRRAEAEQVTEEAVGAARASRDRRRAVSFGLSLGESYLLSNMPEKAVAAYQDALAEARRLSQQRDEAYLTGRIGVALAEAGRVQEAIEYHQRALALARERQISELEGEQLSMLALAHFDLARQHETGNGSGAADGQHLARARAYAESSLEIFARTDQKEQVAKARRLLDDICRITL